MLLITFSRTTFAEKPPANANSEPVYRPLRDITIGSEAVNASGFVLKRDAATFTFKQGTIAFLAPVNGKVTGAVFSGEGEFSLMPPVASEKRSLSLLTKDSQPGLTETFHGLVLRFTDSTYDDIKKGCSAAGAGGSGNFAELLHRSQENARKKIKTNYDARILQDVLSSTPGGLFVAFIDGQKYSGKMLFSIDPHGNEYVAPEEVSLLTYDDSKSGIWAAFHLADEYTQNLAHSTQENTAFDVEDQNLDTKIEKNGYLRGNALTTVVSRVGDLRALNFQLFSTLRVQQVTDVSGAALQFVQEDKDHDADFWVILPKPLAKGEKLQIRTIYEGKDAIVSNGGGNYFPVAREDWYPNSRFGRYSNYDLKFSTPKKVDLIATGALVSRTTEGD